MNGTMSKSTLVDELCSKVQDNHDKTVPKGTMKAILDELAGIAGRELATNEEFTVPGIAKLKVADRQARTGRNPSTGETVRIPARRVVKVKAVKTMQNVVDAAA